MFASLCHQRVQWLNRWIPADAFGPKQEHMLQIGEMESIKLINQAVRDPSRAVSDAVLLSIICMAHHRAPDEISTQFQRTPFNPPFPRLQWLDAYGCLAPNMIHIRGLVELIKLRGGLRNIELDGLATTISLFVYFFRTFDRAWIADLPSSEIFAAAVFCVSPIFDFWPVDETRLDMSVQEMLGFGPSDIQHGFGKLQKIGITFQMAEAFQAAHTYINIVKASLTGPHDTGLLADRRNLTEYTLLSVPAAADISAYFSDPAQQATYEACRLAGLIFGVGVIFPIPAQNSPLNRLAQQIHAILRQPNSTFLWSSPSTQIPLIWILTLGGIAAFGTPVRSFFASALVGIARRSGIHSWADVKKALEAMLWYDLACDQAGEALFLEGYPRLLGADALADNLS